MGKRKFWARVSAAAAALVADSPRVAALSNTTSTLAPATHTPSHGTATATIAGDSLSTELANTLMVGAVAQAKLMGIPMSIAIADSAGNMVTFQRMDQASLISVDIAQDKAYTSAATGMPTDGLHEFIKNDAPLAAGFVHTPRLVVFGGGYPVVIDGAVVGAIGVSGGHYSQDMQVAQAGLAAAGLV